MIPHQQIWVLTCTGQCGQTTFTAAELFVMEKAAWCSLKVLPCGFVLSVRCEAIKKEAELAIPAFQIDIYNQQEASPFCVANADGRLNGYQQEASLRVLLVLDGISSIRKVPELVSQCDFIEELNLNRVELAACTEQKELTAWYFCCYWGCMLG